MHFLGKGGINKMRTLTYSIWSKRGQHVIDCERNDVYIRFDGKIGYIDTVGRFIEDDDLTINSVEIK